MSQLNTLKTTIGFVRTLIRKQFNWSSSSKIDDIYNYLPISDMLSTSGQPTEEQLKSIAAAGFTRIINLAPHDAENSLPDEAATVAALDIPYTHIPVNFARPTQEDFKEFCAVLEANADQPVWVHCAANMRVSAFIYCYRRYVLKEDEEQAKKDLSKIWKPVGVWRKFIQNMAEYGK